MILCFPLSNSKSFVSFILFLKKYLLIYLAVPGLKFHHLTLVVAFEIFPDPRIELGPSAWGMRSLSHGTTSEVPKLHSFFFPFIFIRWRLITLQYCSGYCHTLIWINHGFTCVPHSDPPSHLPLYPIPLGLPSAPALNTRLMHPTWAGHLFHPW